MLEKQVRESLEALNNNKKQMMETNLELLKVTTEVTNAQIKALEEKENKTEEDLKEIEELKLSIKENEEQVAKENKEIEDIGNDLVLSDNSKFNTAEDAIEFIKSKITPDNKERLEVQIKLIEETDNLSRLKEFNHKRTNAYLRKNYNNIMRDLQTKLGRDNTFIYPSIFKLKNEIKKLIHSIYPELPEEELFRRCKEFTSIIGLHLNTIDLKKEGIYSYYFIKNIYEIDNMPLQKRLDYVFDLINTLDNKIQK